MNGKILSTLLTPWVLTHTSVRLRADADRWDSLAKEALDKARRFQAEADGLRAQAELLRHLATGAQDDAKAAQDQADAITAQLSGAGCS